MSKMAPHRGSSMAWAAYVVAQGSNKQEMAAAGSAQAQSCHDVTSATLYWSEEQEAHQDSRGGEREPPFGGGGTR